MAKTHFQIFKYDTSNEMHGMGERQHPVYNMNDYVEI